MCARILGVTLAVAALASPAVAQTTDPGLTSTPSAVAARPATTTVNGDTGLWFVPTADLLPARHWSISAYRVNVDFEQGFTDVSNWPITFAIGLRDRAELFGALTVVNRIDRDVRPLFTGTSVGGIVNDYPFVNSGWTGGNLGDLWVGAKIKLLSPERTAAAAFALRGMVKLPTAYDDRGAGTGRPDVAVDAILSHEINGRVEVTVTSGVIARGDPAGYDLRNGVRWGAGAGFPSRRHLRLTAEVHGEALIGGAVERTGPSIQATDGSLVPSASAQSSPIYATLGLTWLGTRGFFAGAGANFSLRVKGRRDFGSFSDRTGDALGFQVRVGYHRGAR